ncbi:MAG: hypothetical protein M3083_05095 [Actinomycetota bacterium]|nr:hypothetical protein [Actinomycetota bacterium]
MAAARARLSAASSGQAAGDPATAASLSTGDAATIDGAYAKRLAHQISAGDTTDYAFDTLSVTAYPLDGSGRGRLVSETEAKSLNARPSDLASRYAAAMNDGATSGRLPAGSFAPSQSTTGEARSAAVSLVEASQHGTGSQHWDPRPGGQAVALTNGVLVFASARETRQIHKNVEGTARYFVIQDAQRLAFGGFLPPGNYSDVNQTLLVSLAVVVAPPSQPDVVALNTTIETATGVLVR